MWNPYRFLARSDHPIAKGARELRREINHLSLPLPGAVVKPALWAYLAQRELLEQLLRVLVAEPLFKASCAEYGEGLHTGEQIHYVIGKGDIIAGKNVTFDGKCTIVFAARFADRPTLRVGDNTGIGDGCIFTIGKQITIGSNCRIPREVWIFDSSGHPSDPIARKEGLPPSEDDVRPVTIGDNVWIGARSIIHPGVTIGDNSVVSAGSVVVSDVPPDSYVGGNPARRISLPSTSKSTFPPPPDVSRSVAPPPFLR